MRKSKPNRVLAAEVDENLDGGGPLALLAYEHQWIKTTRWALGWTSGALAEALHCTLVYGFVPDKPNA